MIRFVAASASGPLAAMLSASESATLSALPRRSPGTAESVVMVPSGL
jgi:hypothetical protein